MNTDALIAGDMVRIIDPVNPPGSVFYFGERRGIVLRKAHVLSPTCTLYAVVELDPHSIAYRAWAYYPDRLLEELL